jgi:uncharacterized membrane protein YcaP (DUF421 family)
METVVRAFVVYVIIWACFRIVGKRELTQMTPFELVMLLLIPQLLSRALTRQDYSMTNAVVGVTTLFSLLFITSLLSHRFEGFHDLVEAKPTVLLHNGEFIHDHMNRERIDSGDVFSAMHKVGLARMEDIAWAILEGDGKIAIVPKESPRVLPGAEAAKGIAR